jgi:hypothetical protein
VLRLKRLEIRKIVKTVKRAGGKTHPRQSAMKLSQDRAMHEGDNPLF